MLTQSEQQYYDFAAENMASYSLERTPWSKSVYTQELAKPVSQPTHKILCIFLINIYHSEHLEEAATNALEADGLPGALTVTIHHQPIILRISARFLDILGMMSSSPPGLLTATGGVESWWLENWPPGGVALVVGGSMDMREVRGQIKEVLKDKEIDIYMLHAGLWGRNLRPIGKYLLLATKTLFSGTYSNLRNQLFVVLDTCEEHRVLQPEISERDWLNEFGRCDVLLTVSITAEEQKRRRQVLLRSRRRIRYWPKIEITESSWDARQMSLFDIWDNAGRLPFIGFPLPDLYQKNDFWDYIFGWSNVPARFGERDGDQVQFNSIPINSLLEGTTNPRHSPQERIALTFAVCAVQLVSCNAFAPIFQYKRALLFDHQTVWAVTETSVFICSFLSAAGKWSKEATLVFLALQHKQQRSVTELVNLEGRTYDYYLQPWEEDLSWRFRKLLEEMMQVMSDFQQHVLTDLHDWCTKYPELGRPPSNDGFNFQGSPESIGRFLESVMRDAAIAASNVQTAESVPRFNFVFPMQSTRPMPSKCQLHTSRLSRSQARISTTRYSQAFEKVFKHLFHQSDYPRQEGDTAVFPFARGSSKEDRLLGATMFLNLLLEHDEDLDNEDSGEWQLHTVNSREMHDELFTFPSPSWRRWSERVVENNIRFATTPLQFISPGAPEHFEDSAIYVLKRFATPDLLVLSSCIICPQDWNAISTS